ncbi:transcriptional regulator [Mesonia ostreae]|uniref:Transcriptional regulator n=1 Tax=Mesonia ostreae TaxID=861110 RepID=A0ABU2KLP6_9FLAO|nr:transcriptional regulator [Mesonia ostreae]MDT0295657.1 transcriptional regulator [Mesonia ostreae]
MTSIITGDIVASRSKHSPDEYLNKLRYALEIIQPQKSLWEIFRGDSFQVEIENPLQAFWSTIYIKAVIKTIKNLDVRMAIGMGDKTYEAPQITESNGSAFIRSGEIFENLKKEKTNLAIKTGKEFLDKELNTYFQLTLIAMDYWTVNSAEVIQLTMENPKHSQKELGLLIGIKQNTVSERQKRAFWEELQAFNEVFSHKIKSIL